MSLSALLHRDERIVEFGQQEADRHESHGHVGDDEPHDLAGIVAQGVEGWVREAEDDRQDGHRDVSQEWAPEDGDLPVVSRCDDEVEVPGQLAALLEGC